LKEVEQMSNNDHSFSGEHVMEQMARFKVGLPVEVVQQEELAILSAIVLTQLTAEGMENTEAVDELSGRLSSCLHTQMCLRNDDNFNAKAYTTLIRKLTELFR
jgi:hypothetical protein